jgi:hypothetical protein
VHTRATAVLVYRAITHATVATPSAPARHWPIVTVTRHALDIQPQLAVRPIRCKVWQVSLNAALDNIDIQLSLLLTAYGTQIYCIPNLAPYSSSFGSTSLVGCYHDGGSQYCSGTLTPGY